MLLLAAAPIYRGGHRNIALIGLEWIGLWVLMAICLRFALFRPVTAEGQRLHPLLWPVLLSPLLLAVIQLTPVPADWWSSLPGRAVYGDAAQAIDVALPKWRSISIAPDVTRASLLVGIPLAAAFLLGQFANIRQLALLLRVAVGLAVLEVLLGLLQASGGERSPFYFGALTYGAPIGTFGNRNHFGNFLAMALCSYVWLGYDSVRYKMLLQPGAPLRSGLVDDRHKIAAWVAGGLVLVVGILVSRSRGAVLFGLMSGVLCLAAATLRVLGWNRGKWFVAPVAIALVGGALALVGFDSILSRLSGEQLGGSASFRARLALTSLDAAWAFFPWGSGWGTYEFAYPRFQPAGVAGYANFAHMDYIQMFLEGGLAFVLIAACLAWVIFRRAVVLLRSALRDRTLSREAMACALAGIGLFGFLLHSLVDFSMRIPANAIYASLLAGIYLRPLATNRLSNR